MTEDRLSLRVESVESVVGKKKCGWYVLYGAAHPSKNYNMHHYCNYLLYSHQFLREKTLLTYDWTQHK